MATKNEKIYRVLYSAVAGSNLSVREIRSFVEELSSPGEVVHKLQDGLWRLADDLENKFGRPSYVSYESDIIDTNYLADRIYSNVVSRKISKGDLRSMLIDIDHEQEWLRGSSKITTRGMVERFLEEAHPSAAYSLMSILGVDYEEDSFLSGISDKLKGP